MKQEVFYFYNDTYDINLMFATYDSKSNDVRNEVEELTSILEYTSKQDVLDVIECALDSYGFFAANQDKAMILINLDGLNDNIKVQDLLKTLQHECGHFRQYVLDRISENVKNTDSETYLTISDWAFSKCVNTHFFEQFFQKNTK